MSVTVRLAKIGKKHAPAYKVVVSTTRDKRNGNFLDILGSYNPSTNPIIFSLDKKKYQEWVKKGAIVTQAVKKLIEGTYVFKPYKEAKAKKEFENEADKS